MVTMKGARDARKTTPGLRALEKYAVRAGGGSNHRFGLDDAVLIKDNHVALAGGIRPAVERARAYVGHLVKIEVEVDSLDQLREALDLKVDVVLLDILMPDKEGIESIVELRREHPGNRPAQVRRSQARQARESIRPPGGHASNDERLVACRTRAEQGHQPGLPCAIVFREDPHLACHCIRR